MMRTTAGVALIVSICFAGGLPAQTIREYTVMRAPGEIVVDGRLDDPGWEAVPFTEPFVKYADGAAVKHPTRCKMLWDNEYIYIAFVMEDPDVWGKTAVWNDPSYGLYNEEVAEIFIDPDGDGLNYIEVEVNALGAVMDLLMSKAYSAGGKGDLSWTLAGLKVGITVQGTLNNQADVDTSWTCELAFPFSELAFCAPSMNFPPKPDDSWRLNLYRYEYGRDAEGKTPSSLRELSAWNQTDSRGFHVPEKFGRIVFSAETAEVKTSATDTPFIPDTFIVAGNFPNPFNPSTILEFTLSQSGSVRLDIYSVAGQKARALFEGALGTGKHSIEWDGKLENGSSAPSGVYIAHISHGSRTVFHRMLLVK